MIPLHDGMVISFINYEIRVKLEPQAQQEPSEVKIEKSVEEKKAEEVVEETKVETVVEETKTIETKAAEKKVESPDKPDKMTEEEKKKPGETTTPIEEPRAAKIESPRPSKNAETLMEFEPETPRVVKNPRNLG